MKLDELIKKYLKLRDGKSELEAKQKEELKRFTSAMTKIEQLIMAEFNETGQESAKTAVGTAYKSVRTSAKVADRDTFITFVRDNEAWDFLENRVNKSAVEEYMAEHDDLPPGVDISRSATINIRRS